MKVLHITESLGAGVGHYVWLAARGQVASGHTVVLAHSIRHDTPADLDERFAFLAKRVLVPMVTEVSVFKDAFSVWRLASLLQQEQPDVVHLHSSKAGVLGRVAVWLAGRRLRKNTRVFYSPHGFAFLRQDVSAAKQNLFLGFEWVAAKLGGTLVACSATEADLASSQVGHARVRLVENATDLSEVQRSTGSVDGQLNVLNAGRACYQKAPWRFKAVAQQCADLPARFVWLGEGDFARELSGNNVQLTGWLSRTQVAEQLAKADIFLMPSLWEGMPLALIEAQAAGVPAVVSNVVGCKDVVQHGVTGFVCDTDEDLCERTQQLLNDASLRQRMGDNAAQIASTRFAVGRMNNELLKLYMNQDEP
jgi:glycosyltransferase involved in cell wall biosynthesis